MWGFPEIRGTLKGFYRGYMGCYRDNGKENGSYYLGFRVWGFPKIRGTLLGAPIIRTIVFWRLYWDPLNSF